MGYDHKPQVINMYNENIVNAYEPSLRVTYKTDQADPIQFRTCFAGDSHTLKQLSTDVANNFEELSKRIITHITDAADIGIPNNKKAIEKRKSQKEANKPINTFSKTNHWFNEDCQLAKKERKYRQHRWEKTRLSTDMVAYKKAKAKFRIITKKSQK